MSNTQRVDRLLLDINQLAELLHCSVSLLQKKIANDPASLPPFRLFGRKYLWRLDVVLDWISTGPSIKARTKSIGEQLMECAK